MAAPLLMSLCLSTYLFIAIPPTWSNDSVCHLLLDVPAVIPHYPPGYLLPIRWASYLTAGRMESSERGIPVFSTRLVYLIIALQHGLLALGVAFFSTSVAKPGWRVVAAASCLLLCSPVYLYNHGIFTESLTVSLLLILCGASHILYRSAAPPKIASALYYTSLFWLILVRHSNGVFAALLPLLCLANAIRKERRGVWMRRSIQTVTLTLGVLWLAHLSFEGICRSYGIEYRSVFGRAACYYLYEAVKKEPSESRLRELLESRIPDPVTRRAIPGILRSRDPWVGAFRAARDIVEEEYPGGSWEEKEKRSDDILNGVCMAYVTSLDPSYRQEVLKCFTSYLVDRRGTCGEILQASAPCIYVYRSHVYKYFRHFRAFEEDWRPHERFNRFRSGLYCLVTDRLDAVTLFIIASALWTGLAIRHWWRGKPLCLFVPLLLLTGLMHLIAVSIVIVPVSRYMAPTTIMVFAGLGALIGGSDGQIAQE